ncbi:LRRN4 C-terminal-like protein [Silurus meridionalis]|nr:LRRN4 C-terminal-like protein [Silurus meridionalis]
MYGSRNKFSKMYSQLQTINLVSWGRDGIKMQNLTLLLLALSMDFLLAASVNLLTSRPPVTKTRIRYIGVDDEDYGDEETSKLTSKAPEKPGATTTQFTPQECEYDPCVVPKVPCSVIAAQTKCYCPGITGPDEWPSAPDIKELKQGESGMVEVHWCAPQSTVTFYKVITNDGNEPQIFSNSSRTGLLQGVKVGSRVCVVAGNNVGLSTSSETSCTFFQPHKSNRELEMSWVIAGVIGLLLALVLAAVLLWRWRRGRKNGSVDGEGLRNPSYTTNETL